MELQSRKGEVRVLALWGTTRARRARSNGRLAEKLCVRSRGLFRPRLSQKAQQPERFATEGVCRTPRSRGHAATPGGLDALEIGLPPGGQARAARGASSKDAEQRPVGRRQGPDPAGAS